MRQTSIAPTFGLGVDDEAREAALAFPSSSSSSSSRAASLGKFERTNRFHFDDELMQSEMKEKLEKQKRYRRELEMQLSSERKRAEEKEKRCNAPDVTFVDAEISKFFRGDEQKYARKSHAVQVLEADRAEYSPYRRGEAKTAPSPPATTEVEKEEEANKIDKSKQYQRDLLLQIEQNRERKREEKEDEKKMERIRMMSSTSSTTSIGSRYSALLAYTNGDKVNPTAAYGRRESFAREKANAEYESALKMQIEEKKRRNEEEKRKMKEMEIEEERRILRDLERMNVNSNNAVISDKSKTEPVVVVEENVANDNKEDEEEVGELLSFSEFVFPNTDEELEFA